MKGSTQLYKDSIQTRRALRAKSTVKTSPCATSATLEFKSIETFKVNFMDSVQ